MPRQSYNNLSCAGLWCATVRCEGQQAIEDTYPSDGVHVVLQNGKGWTDFTTNCDQIVMYNHSSHILSLLNMVIFQTDNMGSNVQALIWSNHRALTQLQRLVGFPSQRGQKIIVHSQNTQAIIMCYPWECWKVIQAQEACDKPLGSHKINTWLMLMIHRWLKTKEIQANIDLCRSATKVYCSYVAVRLAFSWG